jgi:hypothetical protein
VVAGFEPPAENPLVKTRGKSLSKEGEKKGKTAGAFGNKRKKAPVQPKHIGKRGPRVAREEEPESKKPSPKKSGGRRR